MAFSASRNKYPPPSSPTSSNENRIDKLRKDLVHMWRSRLHSHLPHWHLFDLQSRAYHTAIFSLHRFILASRSPYFRTLLTWGAKSTIPAGSSSPGELLTVALPSPPFTPASLHFTLGNIYSGTLIWGQPR
ncbi:hypothetical protein OG21DRAFT_1487196 [Imleria badia]|nr:hypothetical protein OG21DRAFT_1487196 [Imleria badia]